MTELKAEEVIRILGLEPLPVEGGYYRPTYTGELQLPATVLPFLYRFSATDHFGHLLLSDRRHEVAPAPA